MRICLDARSRYGGGITSYSLNLLKNILAIDSSNEYIILCDTEYDLTGYDHARQRVAPSANLPSRLLWDHTFLPQLLKREKADIYHSFKHVSAFNANTRLIYTVHSAGLYRYPELFGYAHYHFYGWMYRRMARTASFFIAVSEADKRHFMEWSGVPPERVRVTYLAAGDGFREIADANAKERVHLKYGLPRRFILWVGIPHPIKNVHALIQAYARARNEGGIEHKLVVVGKPNDTDYGRRLLRLIRDLGLEDSVVMPGYIREDLPYVYGLADLFVFPSLYESYALPSMEAIVCGTPVIASSVGGIPEIYGDSVVLVDPADVKGLASTITSVLSSSEMRAALRERGLATARLFSWRRCATETLEIYEEAYEAKRRSIH